MKKSERRKASKREDGVDFISNMPDAILLLILSRLESTEEAIRTSILSTRWRYLWTSLPSIEFEFLEGNDNDLRKNRFQEFVYWVLGNRSVDLDSFRLDCEDQFSMSTFGRWIHMAVTRNVKKVDLMFDPRKEYDGEFVMPHCLVTCCSLEVLKLCLHDRGLRFSKFIGFPAVRVLELSYVHLLYNDDLVNDFLKSFPLLEDLSLIACWTSGLELLCISCPKLKKLAITNEEEVKMCDGIKISCPKLVFLELRGPNADNFFFESLYSLKEASIDPEGLDSAPEADLIDKTISVLIPGISHVESLQIDLHFFCQCVYAAHDPALPNLKTLVLTTTFDAFTMDELTRILDYYLKLESFKLIIKEVFAYQMKFNEWEDRKLDEAETRSSLNPDLKRVEFLEFIGEKPKLVFDRCSWDGFQFMEMVFSWANKANDSH